ncbi:MAG: hypothetical protein K9I94_02095 [Bacteroidales bacterium]|nr:hypothetical protein [Bacteroidales bacterium]
MANIIITTVPGLDKLAMREIKDITGKDPEYAHKGMLRLDGEMDDVLHLNYRGKMLQKVFWQLAEAHFEKKDEIPETIHQLPLNELIKEDQSFAADTDRHGEHDFTSTGINRLAGEAIINRFRNLTGKRLAVNLDKPDITFRIFIRHQQCIIALDTTGTGLHMRHYRRYLHPAGLNACVANAMVRLSEWTPGESLIDPMCGSGTTCIEAILMANRIPNEQKDFPCLRFPFIDKAHLMKLKAKIEDEKLDQPLSVFGADIDRKALIGARKNAEKAGVPPDFIEGDATKIPLDHDRIILNPPFGLRMGSYRTVEELYEKFLEHLFQHNWKRTVILTARPYLIPETLVHQRINVESGKLPMSILLLEK